MEITLTKARLSNCEELYSLQTVSFRPLLEKYQDYDSNPGAETKDRTLQRLKDPFSDYYFISLDGKHIGAIRICHFETLCKLKQLFILPEFQGHGYAQHRTGRSPVSGDSEMGTRHNQPGGEALPFV